MKSKDRKNLHTKNKGELTKELQEARQALHTMQLDHSQFKLKNTSSLAIKKKEIAQILTVLNRKDSE
jgi:ribosomal protein L29